MKSYFKSNYAGIKEKYLDNFASFVPKKYHSTFVHLGGGVDQVYFLRQLRPKDKQLRILIVGVYGGRDFWGLRFKVHDLFGMDLEVISDCEPTVAGDAEGIWPFSDEFFDVIIIGEVLEHLLFDMNALREASRALRKDGSLIVTVPFWSHDDPTHNRTYSPKTIIRLLDCCGFEVSDFLERPGFIFLNLLNYIIFPFALIYYFFSKKSLYAIVLPIICRLEFSLSKIRWPRIMLDVLGIINWGCTIRAVRSSSSFDYKNGNKDTFTKSSKF